MAKSDLREYVELLMKLAGDLIRLYTEWRAVFNRIAEKAQRFDFDLDPEWVALDEIKQALVLADCDSFPGLVRFRNYMSTTSVDLCEEIHGLESALGELSSEDRGISGAAVFVMLQLFPKAFETLEARLPQLDFDAEAGDIILLLNLLLAAEQTAYVRRLFEDEKFAKYRFKDRFKPHYFTLLAELGESRADDFKRMVPELEETVDEIRANVLKLRRNYSPPSKLISPANSD